MCYVLSGGTYPKGLLGNCTSISRPLTCGVPQEPILSPILFRIYMQPLAELLRQHGVKYQQYIDNTEFYLSFTAYDTIVLKLAQCLAKISSCMYSSWLMLLPHKKQVMLVGRGEHFEGFASISHCSLVKEAYL